MNKQKILILGAGGFIGTNLIQFYSERPDYEVYATVHTHEPQVKPENVTFYRVDLINKEEVNNLFDIIQPNICIIAAANTSSSKDVIEHPYYHLTDNVSMNAFILEACHVAKVSKVIYFSCSTMLQDNKLPQKESDWHLGDEIYPVYRMVASMKVFTENMCQYYSELKNNVCQFTVIRNSNIFGPFDKTDPARCHLMSATISKVFNALDKIEIWGDEKNQAHRDFVYIDDLVDLVDRVLKYQETPYELFNCGAGKAYPVTEIVKTVQRVLGKEDLQLTYNINKPNIPTTTILDWTKAFEELGWYPKVGLEDGIARTVEWYKENYK